MSTELEAPDHWIDINKLLVDDPSFKLTPEVKELFIQYAGVPEDQIVKHVLDVRDRAYKIFPYPCLGQFNFLDFGVATAPKYNDVLDGVKGGKTLLDVGCCFGQDLRKLIHDGASASQLTAFEMKRDFIDLGHELFRDRETLKAEIVCGDLFAGVPELEGREFEYIHASSFFHLFSWDEQVTLLGKVLSLLKKEPGSMIFGRQAGSEKAGFVKHGMARVGEMFRHDQTSLEKMVEEATKGSWAAGRVDVEVGMFLRIVAGNEWVMMNYAIVVK